MINSVKRFMRNEANRGAVEDFIWYRNVNQEIPEHIYENLAKRIVEHMKKPTKRNSNRFLMLCVAYYYQNCMITTMIIFCSHPINVIMAIQGEVHNEKFATEEQDVFCITGRSIG